MYEGADGHNSLTGGIAVKGLLPRAETARRFNPVSLSHHLQFKSFLAGDARALLSRDNLAVAAMTGDDDNGFAFAVFHLLKKPGTVKQIVLQNLAEGRRGNGKIADETERAPPRSQKITCGFIEI